MSDLEVALKAMVDHPHRPPPPLPELERRVAQRRRRRGAWRAVGVAAAVLVVATAVPLLGVVGHRGTVVHTGPTAERPTATIPYRLGALELQMPERWQALTGGDGGPAAVGTRRLTDRDLALALLARDDPAFHDFPADGVVFVVGNDGRQPGPFAAGPVQGLGPTTTLPGGIRVRRGELPDSPWQLAAYLGPGTSDEAVRAVEILAPTVRALPGAVSSSPPPEGSSPGFEAGPVTVADDRLRQAATTSAGGWGFSLAVGDGCAVLTAAMGDQANRVAGSCPRGPRTDGVAYVGAAPTSRPFPPGSQPWDPGGMDAVMFRAGPSVTAVRASLVDGRAVDAALGFDGWGLAAAQGRIFYLEAFDAAGQVVGHVAVP